MPHGVSFPPALRAVVVAEIAAGGVIREVARRHGVSHQVARRWFVEDGPVQPDLARTRERMAELIYDTLADILGAVRVQLQAASREEWLEKQTAGDIAGLLGAELDRAVRLLSGFRPAGEPDPIAELDTPTPPEAA